MKLVLDDVGINMVDLLAKLRKYGENERHALKKNKLG